MQIIDDKGRLFGKINVIDFLLIAFLVSLTPMFYFSYKIINKKPQQEASEREAQKQEFVAIEDIYCLFIKVKPEIAEIISVGDKELDLNGEPIGEVVEVGNISPYVYELEIGSAEKLAQEDPILKQISVKLKIRAEIRQNKIYYKDKQILNNGIIEFTTNKYKTEAVCLLKKKAKPTMSEIEEANVDKRLADVEVRLNTLEKSVEVRLNTLEKSVEVRLNTLEKSVDSLLPQKSKKR